MKIVVIAMTRRGIALAGRVAAALPGACLCVPEKFRATVPNTVATPVTGYPGKLGDRMPALFAAFDGIVAIVALGAVVRLIAPHLKGKASDPAVIVMDEAARFVVPVLSGHLGGANQLAGHLAAALGATPVLTTATDVRASIAVDLLGRELGWKLDATPAEIVRCSAAMVNDEPVALVQESGSKDWWTGHANGRTGPLPTNVTLFERLEEVDATRFAAVLWIAGRKMPYAYAACLAGRRVVYRPANAA